MLKDKKSKQLGMSYSTASNRLKKMLFYKLVKENNLHYCYRCEDEIESHTDLSIDHMESWLDSSTDLFWDLDNISYSHISCNSAKSASSSMNVHPSYNTYTMGCRCKACVMCKAMYQRYARWVKKRKK